MDTIFIKDILTDVQGAKKVEIMAFKGTVNSFFTCIEIITTNGKQYLFNFNVEKIGDHVSIFLKINGTSKEFKDTVKSLVESLVAHFENIYGTNLKFTIKKELIIKEVLADFLFLKS